MKSYRLQLKVRTYDTLFFFQMHSLRTKLCREAKSVAIELMQDENSVSKVTILPPEDVDENTDTDEIDDTLTGAQIPSGDIAGLYEIEYKGDEEEMDFEEIVPPKKKRKIDTHWTEFNYDEKVISFTKATFDEKAVTETLEQKLKNDDPVSLFETFFDEQLLDLLVEETMKYASQRNVHNFQIEKGEMRIFIGILIFTGYHCLPREKLYWSLREDFGTPIVRQAMSRDRFWEIKRFFHVADNNLAKSFPNKKDFKISPLYDYLNDKFKQFGVLDENIAIDEQMVRYFGHSSFKQFIKNKPIRFGMKNWTAAGKSGYCYHVKLYCGKEENASNEPLGSRVVLDLSEKCNITQENCLFADNFFMSHDLLCKLSEKKIPAVGTLRSNRTSNCPLLDDKTLKRGDMDSKLDTLNEIVITKWSDNKCVIVGSNFQTTFSANTNVKRWKKLKEGAARLEVPIPSMIKLYNQGMGGVDQLDSFVNCYRISITSKKWYWCLLTNLIDITVSNAWNLQRKLARTQMDLLEFKSYIALCYLKTGTQGQSRPTIRCKTIPKPIDVIRFDGVGHSLSKRDSQRRCQNAKCMSKPKTFCKKCDITLCKYCFGPFHDSSSGPK